MKWIWRNIKKYEAKYENIIFFDIKRSLFKKKFGYTTVDCEN